MAIGKLGRRGGFGSAGDLGSASNSLKMRAISGSTFVVNEAGGGTNKFIRWTEVHPCFTRFTGRMYAHWPNWRSAGTGSVLGGGVEVGSGSAATLEGVYITYYDATTGQPTVKYFTDTTLGTQGMSAADNADFIGYVDVDIAAGSHFTYDGAGSFPAGMVYIQNCADRTNGDVFQFGTSQILLSSTPTNSAFVTLAWYGAYRIRGLSNQRAAGVIGDSRDAAYKDTANDVWGARGQWPRLVGKYMPNINASVSGETAVDFAVLANNPKRYAALQDADFVCIGTGINDNYFNGRTAAQVLADNLTIGANTGKPFILKTLDPVINYPGNTVNNSAGDARRQTYNALVRARSLYYDPAISNESGSTGTFVSISYVNDDGTHETNVGNDNSTGNASAVAVLAYFGFTTSQKLSFASWDISNLAAATVSQWLHPSDYVVGSWPARVGVSAIGGGTNPTVGGSGGAVLDSTHYLTSTLSASNDAEYVAITANPTSLTGNQAFLGASANGGREFRFSSGTQLTLNKQSTSQRGSVAGVSPAMTAGSLQVVDKVDSDSVNILFGQNGKSYDSGATGSTNQYTAALTTTYGRAGVGASDVFSGTLFEVVALNAAPTAALRQKIQARLAWRAGAQASLDSSNPYVSAAPTL